MAKPDPALVGAYVFSRLDLDAQTLVEVARMSLSDDGDVQFSGDAEFVEELREGVEIFLDDLFETSLALPAMGAGFVEACMRFYSDPVSSIGCSKLSLLEAAQRRNTHSSSSQEVEEDNAATMLVA